MAMKYTKKELNDYVQKLMNTAIQKDSLKYKENVIAVFEPIITPLMLALPDGEKIKKLAKQLSNAISELEEKDPKIRYEYTIPSSYRNVSSSIDFLARNNMNEEIRKEVNTYICNGVIEDRRERVVNRISRLAGGSEHVVLQDVLAAYAKAYTHAIDHKTEVESIKQITKEALTIIKTEKSAKKAFAILKGMNYPLDEFEKKMLAKKPELPAVYKFSKPVCKLTASCEE